MPRGKQTKPRLGTATVPVDNKTLLCEERSRDAITSLYRCIDALQKSIPSHGVAHSQSNHSVDLARRPEQRPRPAHRLLASWCKSHIRQHVDGNGANQPPKQTPYSIELRQLSVFVAYSIISCPPNYLWQSWLEASFPGYSESLTPREKEKLVDETVVGRSTSISPEKDSLRARDEKQAALTSASAPQPAKVKKQLSIRNTAVKFLLDQTVGSVVNTVMFIMGTAMLRGQSWEQSVVATRDGFWPLIFAGYKLWPLVSILSLTLVPVESRMVFGSIVGVGWGIFLSLMAGGKEKRE